MTSLEILSAHLELSVDEIRYIAEHWDDIAYRLECNMDQLYEDYMDVELSVDQADMVNPSVYKMIQPQTPMSLLIDRLGGAPLWRMRFILDNMAATGYVYGSIQRWRDDWMDFSNSDDFSDYGFEDEIRQALIPSP